MTADRKNSGESAMIIYFDGACNLCNGFIDFLIQVDQSRSLIFAPLQGTTTHARGSSRGEAIHSSLLTTV